MMFGKKENVYGDIVKEFRPTIRSLLIQILQQKLFNMRRGKQSIYNSGAKFVPEGDKLKSFPLKYIALINDGTVEEMIRINEESAKTLLSKKTKLVEFDPKTTIVKKGMKYIDKQFVEDTKNDQKD